MTHNNNNKGNKLMNNHHDNDRVERCDEMVSSGGGGSPQQERRNRKRLRPRGWRSLHYGYGSNNGNTTTLSVLTRGAELRARMIACHPVTVHWDARWWKKCEFVVCFLDHLDIPWEPEIPHIFEICTYGQQFEEGMNILENNCEASGSFAALVGLVLGTCIGYGLADEGDLHVLQDSVIDGLLSTTALERTET